MGAASFWPAMSRDRHAYRFGVWTWVLAVVAWCFLWLWAFAPQLGLDVLFNAPARNWMFVLVTTTPLAFLLRHGVGWLTAHREASKQLD